MAADALGRLDHSYWLVADGSEAKAAFQRLGFTLNATPKVQADGALSTFAFFRDRTYLEIVEDRSEASQAAIASGANPQAAGGIVRDCTVTAASLAERGLTLTLGQGAGFAHAAFPGDSLLSRVFFYSHPHAEKPAETGKDAAFEQHANGALGLRESWLAVTDLERTTELFAGAGFPLVAAALAVDPLQARGVALGWGAHRILLLEPAGPASPLAEPLARIGPHPIGVRLAADMPAATHALASLAEPWDEALLAGPTHALGAWIAFGAEGTWTG